MTEKESKKFAELYSDLVPWMPDHLAHSLAKKLSRDDVASLIATFRRIVTESKQLQQKETENVK